MRIILQMEMICKNKNYFFQNIIIEPINKNLIRFNEEEDKYLMCLMFKYGYRNWNLIKNHILHDPMMKFNLNMKVKYAFLVFI